MEPLFYNQMPDTRVRLRVGLAGLLHGDECMVVAGRRGTGNVELVAIEPTPAVNRGRRPARGVGHRGYMVGADTAGERFEIVEAEQVAPTAPVETIEPTMPQTLVEMTSYDEHDSECEGCGLISGDRCYMRGRGADDYPIEIYTAPDNESVNSGGGRDGAWVLSLEHARRWFTIVNTAATAAVVADDPVLAELKSRRAVSSSSRVLSNVDAMKAYWTCRSSIDYKQSYLAPTATTADPFAGTTIASLWFAWLIKQGCGVSPVVTTAAQRTALAQAVDRIDEIWREITTDPALPIPPPNVYDQLRDNY